MKVRNVFGNEYSGTIGKALTVCTRYGRQYIRKWTKPRDPKTPWQLEQREKFAEANEAWKALSYDERQGYNERAKGMNMSGYCLFVSEFVKKRGNKEWQTTRAIPGN
ncbi:MAG: hypothetical protein HZB92_07405 [Euryarchaeota archaeon]|nr:hypothetical protein [Euryarchaeota archaeon]